MHNSHQLCPALIAAALLFACGGGGDERISVTPPGDVGFDPGNPTSLAENGVPITLTVQLAEALGEDVAFDLLLGGTVEAGDVTLVPEQLLIGAGDLQAQFVLRPNDDAVFEGDELVLLSLQQTGGTPLNLGGQNLTVNLIDDEPMPTLRFETDASSTSEFNASHSVLITLSGPAEGVVAFGLDLGGSATLNLDYALDTSSLSIAPLALSRSVVITPFNDGMDEEDETVTLALKTPLGAELESPGLHSVALQDTPTTTGLAFTAKRIEGSRPLLVTDSDGSATADLTGFLGTENDARDLLPSGNGTLIAFRGTVDAEDGIFVVPAAGGTPLRVTPIPTGFHQFDDDFAWSFDDQFLAFRMNLLGESTLYTVRPDGTGLTQLVESFPGLFVPSFAWSPNALELAWSQGFQQGPFLIAGTLWTANADGSEIVQRSDKPVSRGVQPDFHWGASGERLYYRADNISAQRFDVFQVQLNGAPEVLMTPASEGDASDLFPRPNSDQVAFVGRYEVAQVPELFLIDPSGVAPIELSDSSEFVTVSQPAWAPDGSRIAFTTGGPAGNTSLQSVLPDGTGAEDLQFAGGSVVEFAWAPDSSGLAYRADGGLYTAEPDGPGQQLAPNFSFGSGPWWSPDSTRVAAITSGVFVGPGGGGTDVDLLAIQVGSGEALRVEASIEIASFDGDPQWSPDSAFLAYVQFIASFQRLYVGSALVPEMSKEVSGTGLTSTGFSSFLWLD